MPGQLHHIVIIRNHSSRARAPGWAGRRAASAGPVACSRELRPAGREVVEPTPSLSRGSQSEYLHAEAGGLGDVGNGSSDADLSAGSTPNGG
jgi:hypothetical protein